MVIWRDVPVRICRKGSHIRKIGGKNLSGFYKDCGDLPWLVFNNITGKFEAVMNPRGRAYATRNSFRDGKKVPSV